MGKKARELRSNMYEGDIDILDAVVKVKNIERDKVRNPSRPYIQEKEVKHVTSLDTPISDRIVPCACNKCGQNVNGTLTSYIYSSSFDAVGLCTPFVTYDCAKCGHAGRRSVLSKALAPRDFELYYFS